ncbi:MAG: hypothetical protein ACI94Y_001483 [Maribacter sp.]|jgi:hypothetical protein
MNKINFIFFLILILSCNSAAQRSSILAGYFPASIMDAHLEVYVDSTFKLSYLETIHGTWNTIDDTIILLKNNNLCAKIYNDELIEYYSNEFRVLETMEIKSFDPPEIVQFPNE